MNHLILLTLKITNNDLSKNVIPKKGQFYLSIEYSSFKSRFKNVNSLKPLPTFSVNIFQISDCLVGTL